MKRVTVERQAGDQLQAALDCAPLRVGMQGDRVRMHLKDEVGDCVGRIDVPPVGRVVHAHEAGTRSCRS